MIVVDSKATHAEHQIESYAVEAAFYRAAASAVSEARLTIPTLLHVEHSGGVFCFLMKDLQLLYPLHPGFLPPHQARAAVEWLASFHAVFWEAAALPAGIWERGTFWSLDKKDNAAKVNSIASAWSGSLQWFKKKSPGECTASLKTLGARLQSVMGVLDVALNGGPKKPGKSKAKASSFLGKHRTVIHGDYKAANMFLDEAPSCAVCDFQYAGGGYGASDLCYLLYPDARGDYLEHEEPLLDFYYERLCDRLEGREGSYTRERLGEHYELAQLHFMGHMLSSGWVASQASDLAMAQKADAMLSKWDVGTEAAGPAALAAALERAGIM